MKRTLILLILATSLSASAQGLFEKTIIIEINKFRTENGLDTLVWSGRLYQASYHHAKWVSLTDIFSHTENLQAGKLKTLKGLEERFIEYGCFNEEVTGQNENLVGLAEHEINVAGAQKAVRCWIRSQGHRENLLFDSENPAKALSVISIAVCVSPTTHNAYVVMNIGVQAKYRRCR